MSVIGPKFEQWVHETIEERNSKISISNNLNIDIAPELLEAFKASTAVSSKFDFVLFKSFLSMLNNKYYVSC